MIVRDATGTIINFDAPPRCIVSIVPSLTESLFAFGAGDRVAGVTRFCEEPAERVGELPKVGGTKTPDLVAIAALQPDLVVASIEENREEDVAALRRAGRCVYVTHYPTVRAAVSGLIELARIVGVEPDRCGWLAAAHARLARPSKASTAPVRYFCPIWRRPYMVARSDTYMSDLMALAGGVSCFSDERAVHYFPVALSTLPTAAPEVILLPDEPFRFAERHLADFAPYEQVPAVTSNRVYFVDGKALTWYGPRTAAAIDYFAGLLASAGKETAPASRSRTHAV